jgi:hypothetical protein
MTGRAADPTGPQMTTGLRALAHAAAYRRAMVAAWCDPVRGDAGWRLPGATVAGS